MSLLSLRRPWDRQPTDWVEIDWNNDLVQALGGDKLHVMLPEQGVILRAGAPLQLVRLGTPKISEIAENECALDGSGSSDDGWSTESNFDVLSGATSLSGYVIGANMDSGAVVGRWSSPAGNGGFLVTGGYPGGGNLAVLVDTGGFNVRARYVSPGTGRRRFGFTWRGHYDIDTYLDGVATGTYDGIGNDITAIQTVGEKLYFCRHGDSGSGTANPAKPSLVILAPNAAWSADLHAELDRDPWQIFVPRSVRVGVSSGTVYGVSISESFSSSDSSSVVVTFSAAGSDSLSTADTPSVVWITSSSLSDSLTVTDASSCVFTTAANGSESVSTTDNPSAGTTTAASGSESISSTDSGDGVITNTAVAAESVSTSDSQFVTTVGVVTTNESVSSTDSQSAATTTSATGSESVSSSDACDWNASGTAASCAESASLTDTQSAIATFLAAVSEAVAAASIEGAIFTTSTSAAEATSLLDLVDFSGSSSASIGEALSAADSQSALRLVSGGVVEALSVADAWNALTTVYGQAGETLTLLDTPEATATLGASVIELVALSDTHYGFTVWSVERGGVFVRQAASNVVVRGVTPSTTFVRLH